jgi:hypothetical protein
VFALGSGQLSLYRCVPKNDKPELALSAYPPGIRIKSEHFHLMPLPHVDKISSYLTFQGLLVLVASDKHLPHERLAVACYVPDASVVRWHSTPTQHLKATIIFFMLVVPYIW